MQKKTTCKSNAVLYVAKPFGKLDKLAPVKTLRPSHWLVIFLHIVIKPEIYHFHD